MEMFNPQSFSDGLECVVAATYMCICSPQVLIIIFIDSIILKESNTVPTSIDIQWVLWSGP